MGSDETEEFSMEEEASSSVMLSPGTISRRIVKASPLKHVAHLLRQKLVSANGAPCNMFQVGSNQFPFVLISAGLRCMVTEIFPSPAHYLKANQVYE